MIDSLRKQPVSCVGVEIFDTELYFVELKPVGGTSLLPAKHGRVGITFDAIEEGKIINKTKIIQSLKKVKDQTTSSCVVFSALADDKQTNQWQEMFSVAGFTAVTSIDRGRLLRGLLSSDNNQERIIGYFSDANNFSLYGPHEVNLTYPFDVFSLVKIKNVLEKHEDRTIAVMGHFPVGAEMMQSVFTDYKISVILADIWTRCFSIKDHVPEVPYQETFAYSLPVACALQGAKYAVVSQVTDTPSDRADNVPGHGPSLQESMKKSSSVEQENVHIDPVPPKPQPVIPVSAKPRDVTPIDASHTLPARPKEVLLPRVKNILSLTRPSPDKASLVDQTPKTKSSVTEKRDDAKTTDSIVENKKQPATTTQVSQAKKIRPRSIWLQDSDELIYALWGRMMNRPSNPQS